MHHVDSVAVGIVSRDTSLASATHSNQKVRFKSFVRFLNKCCLEKDPFLTNFVRSHHNVVVLAFAHSIRCNEHGKTTKYTLLAVTLKDAIGDVVKNFR